jgi:hypothetical protein
MNIERKFVSPLSKEGRASLEQKLHDRQSGKCFICDEIVDLILHHGQLDIDHIVSLTDGVAQAQLSLRRNNSRIEFSLPEVGDNSIYSCPFYKDPLKMLSPLTVFTFDMGRSVNYSGA